MPLSLKIFLAALICAALLPVGTLHAQDDMGAPPPPSDNQAPDDGTQQAPPGQTDSDQSASFQTFYDNLGSQGSWIQTNDYGYVWQPQVNDPDWAPYTDGHWVYTDDGWTWVTDEPWGWATYHYGRWVNLDGTGWCWVPGYTWAPAWVSWRYGDDYCGWAPLPPDSFVGIDYSESDFGIGFHIGGDCDSYYGIGAGCYHFLPINCLGYHNYHGCYAPSHKNYGIINHTTNVTNINVTNHGSHGSGFGGAHGGGFHHVTTGGPSFAQVNSLSKDPIQKVGLVHSHQPGGGTISNNSLALYAPHLNGQAAGNLKPATVAQSFDHVSVNRGVDITKPLVVNQHLAPAAPTAGEVQQAQLAQFSAPAHAKVVTSDTPVHPVLEAPLNTLKPYSTSPAQSSQSATPHTTYGPSGGNNYSVTPNGATIHNYPSENGTYVAPHTFQPGSAYPSAPSQSEHPRYGPAGTTAGTTVHPATPPSNSQSQSHAQPSSSGGSRSGGFNGGQGQSAPSGASGGNGGGGGFHSGGQQGH